MGCAMELVRRTCSLCFCERAPCPGMGHLDVKTIKIEDTFGNAANPEELMSMLPATSAETVQLAHARR
eukprot:7852430-Lingulodinium_polyedra.AAC.1